MAGTRRNSWYGLPLWARCRSTSERLVKAVFMALSGENAAEDQIGELRNQILCLQLAFRLVPLVDPVDHAEQGKGGGTRSDLPFGVMRLLSLVLCFLLNFLLNFGHEVFEEVNVFLFAGVDALAQRRGKGMVFVQHHWDLAIARA